VNNPIKKAVENIGKDAIAIAKSSQVFFHHTYDISLLGSRTFSRLFLFLKNIDISIHQMKILGVDSLPLVIAISIFVGAETVIQGAYQFSGFIPLRYLGYAVCKMIITETAPVITSVIVAGRIAASMGAEIGNMKSTEQIDAMECLNLDPVRYLVVPRVMSCMIMLPVLVLFSYLFAIITAIITAVVFIDLTLHEFIMSLKFHFMARDVFVGILKTSIFGILVALVGCHFGFSAKKGAQGTGDAASRAVVVSCAMILVVDFIVSYLTM